MKWEHFQGGSQIILEIETGSDFAEREGAAAKSVEILDRRLDEFGIDRRIVRIQDENRIVIQLPPDNDVERLSLLMQGGFLELKLVEDAVKLAEIVESIDAKLRVSEGISDLAMGDDKEAVKGAEGTTMMSLDDLLFPGVKGEKRETNATSLLSSLMVTFPVGNGDPDIAVSVDDVSEVDMLLAREDISTLIPKDVRFHWGPNISLRDGREYRQLFLLARESEITGRHFSNASTTIGSSSDPIVNLEMTDNGAVLFERLTGRHVGERLAIVLDGVVKSAPVIRQRISGGRAQIEGIETINEARDLAIVIRAGALPAPIKVIEIQELTEELWLGEKAAF
jgi:protein-export membrane protein SecD